MAYTVKSYEAYATYLSQKTKEAKLAYLNALDFTEELLFNLNVVKGHGVGTGLRTKSGDEKMRIKAVGEIIAQFGSISELEKKHKEAVKETERLKYVWYMCQGDEVCLSSS